MPYANVGPKNGNGIRLTWRKESHAQMVIATFTEGMPESAELDTALWVDLDRSQINTLIRHLRDARDGVFGKDE